MKKEVHILAEFCDKSIDLTQATLCDEYYYQSLPLCILDAVFSIGVRYSSTRNVVIRYCNYHGLKRIRTDKNSIPPLSEQESVDSFGKKIKSRGVDFFTSEVFKNRQRTSSVGGILKTEAVLQFAETLKDHGVNYFQYIDKIINNQEFERDIKKIKGQKSGISLKYFFMLAGSEELVKPDRMIIGFIEGILRRKISFEEAQELLSDVVNELQIKHSHLTPRLLDYVIWSFQRER